ncbi:MAG: response regulator [Thaumarchaeota archaeon]|nr:response regulator [Nitrososphaerota archaeon]
MSLATKTNASELLIVDDSTAIRMLLKEIIALGNIKKKIIEADNGVDAVKLFQQYKPDLIILDIFMPRADGLQVLQAMSKINKRAKIIITTASENIKFAEQSKNHYRISGVLLKPFTKQYALQIINQVMNQPW